MKLHTKLYLFFAGIVLFPLLVVTVAASLVLGRSATETYQGRLQSGIVAASAIISAQAQALSGDSQAALQASDPAALLSGGDAARTAILGSLASRAKASGATLQDGTGKTVAATGTGATGATAGASANGPAGTAPQIISTINLAKADGSIWRLTLYQPCDSEAVARVFSAQGLEWGLLQNGIAEAGSLPAGTAVLAEDGAPLQSLDLTEPSGVLQVSAGERELLASGLMLPREITSGQTVLFADVPSSTVGAASRQVLEVGLGLMLAVAFMAGTLGFFMARNITQPLRDLTRAAAAGIEGDLWQRVEVKSKDEVGSLADSFGQMQSSIRDYISELEESRTQLLLALSYAGEILGSTSDRARMMKTTAEAARLATGASGIWVELFPGKHSTEMTGVSAGVPSHFFDDRAKRQTQSLVDGVTAGSLTSGTVLEFSNGFEAVAYPLIFEREALGAMVAIFEKGRLAEENLKILASLAAQAATAVENVNFGELQQLLATTDPMTNLFNFRYLCNCLDKEISKSRRYGRNLSLAIIDLDDFKSVNDTYGHQAGDRLLRAVADVLDGQVREADMVARYGGEEFSVVFPETVKADAMKVVEKLRRKIAEIELEDYPEVRVTASIGVASLPEDGADKTELLMRADDAMYRAKGAGKNCSVAA
ncbi:MAG: GGDEF domain-containing protein [Thermoleophilia bacterium]